MKKIIFFLGVLCLGIATTSCNKDKGEEPIVNPSDYQISADKKQLIKWLNPETTSVDMQSDVNLRQVTIIGKDAFKNHNKLTSVVFPSGIEKIQEEAFRGANLSGELIIPPSVTNIEKEAFANTKLSSVVVKGYPILGTSTFSQCFDLKSIVFERGIDKLPRNTFHTCSKLEKVTINGYLESLGEYAFSRCANLKEINLWQVSSIGEGAFALCTQLRSVIISTSSKVPDVGNDIFLDVSPIPNIYVKPHLVNDYKNTQGWKSYGDTIFPMP